MSLPLNNVDLAQIPIDYILFLVIASDKVLFR